MIPYSRQAISKKDINAVNKVLKSKFLTQGPEVKKFEYFIKKFTKAKYAIAVNSGTSALHLSCLGLGLNKNDYLWTAPNTFVSTANCALHCGAKVDFVDIDKDDFNISIEKLKYKLKHTRPSKLPKILIPVHFAGLPTYQDEIFKLSKKYGFRVIEDASHSLGATYKKEKVGSCKWSDITVLSFHPVKIATSGEGGMILTNNKKVYDKIKILRTHGIYKAKSFKPWYYEQLDLGYNFRMSDIHAALGLSQSKSIKKFINKRNKIAKTYLNKLKNLPIKFQKINKYCKSTYHLFTISIELKKIKNTYNKIFSTLRNNNIFVNLHYLPVHLHPYYKKMGFKKNDFPISEDYSNRSMSIPVFYNLNIRSQNKVIILLKKLTKLK